MSKKIHKSIQGSLKILTFLAFVTLFLPFNQAAAQSAYGTYGGAYGGYGNAPSNNYNNNNLLFSSTYNPVATVNYNPGVVYSRTTVRHTVAKKTTPTTTVACAPVQTPATTNDNTNSGNGQTYGNLAANALFGSNSFLPNGLVQWILLAIFILIIVILVRHLFGYKRDYHESPLKHA